VTFVKQITVPAGGGTGLFAGLGISAGAGTSYEIMVYAPSESGLQLGDNNFSTDPEATLPMISPFRVGSAQPAALPGDDIFLVNPGSANVQVTAMAWKR
jgi:hypothetical protein